MPLGDPLLLRRPCHLDHGQVKSVSELNKLMVRLFFEAVWNEGRLELIVELIARTTSATSPAPARQ
jgi:hypothetical protein